jgi:hypothetical protein
MDYFELRSITQLLLSVARLKQTVAVNSIVNFVPFYDLFFLFKPANKTQSNTTYCLEKRVGRISISR